MQLLHWLERPVAPVARVAGMGLLLLAVAGGMRGAGAQVVDLAAVRARAAGLRQVALTVIVDGRGKSPRLSAAALETGILDVLARRGAVVVPRSRATSATLLVNVHLDCAEATPACAVAVLLTRPAVVGRTRSGEALVSQHGPVVFHAPTWDRVAVLVHAYTSESGYLVSGLTAAR